MTALHRGQPNSPTGLPSDRSDTRHHLVSTSYPGRLGNASTIGTKVSPPRSSAMTTASAPSDLPDLMASAHSSLADFNACERASSMVASSEPSGSWISSAPSNPSASSSTLGNDPRSGWPQRRRGPLIGSPHASRSHSLGIWKGRFRQVNIAHARRPKRKPRGGAK